jgi:SAM-dependent methyltransferase
MSDQAHFWSEAATIYEREFVDPYRAAVRSPLLETLAKVADAGVKTAADLGCGLGPLLPFLAERYGRVVAVDFAAGMLAKARERCRGLANVEFLETSLVNLEPLRVQVDVAVAVNSLVMPDVAEQEAVLRQIHGSLRPGGLFVGIVPAMDAVHYYTMLLVDRALDAGKPLAVARQNAAHFNDHAMYDFAFGQFRFRGIEQHFWQPFEIRYRLRRAGFRKIRLSRVWLDWHQFACAKDLLNKPPPWDWFLAATPSRRTGKPDAHTT